jgi:hypothetical protein
VRGCTESEGLPLVGTVFHRNNLVQGTPCRIRPGYFLSVDTHSVKRILTKIDATSLDMVARAGVRTDDDKPRVPVH